MTPLCEIAARRGTDKLAGGYTAFYHALLRFGRQAARKVLEVGIGFPEIMPHMPGYKAGASLRMWGEYFPHAEIWGIDTNPNAAAEARGGKIHTIVLDSRTANVEEWAGRDFDLIVDDGNHSGEAQLATLGNLYRLLAPGGIYIIEDSHPDLRLDVPHVTVVLPVPIGAGRCTIVY